jgi:pyruvate-formate lyase-activating enzyme
MVLSSMPSPLAALSNTRLLAARWRKLARGGVPIARHVLSSVTPSKLGLSGALVQIENTNYCNFRCSYCPTHSAESTLGKPRLGHMSVERFEAVLDDHPRAQIVVLQGQGEPLMDPTLFDKLRIARARGLLTQIISNGSLLDDRMRDRLWSAGPDIVLFSIDSASGQRNEATRKGLRYLEVTARIRRLTEARTERPMVVGLLSIVHGAFDDEVEKALLRFNDLGIDVLLYKQLNPSFENRIDGYVAPPVNGVPAGVRRRLNYVLSHQRVARVAPCAQVHFDWPYYLWQGTRTPCCVLNDERYTAAEFSRPALLERFAKKRLPSECERCSFFGGYPS